MKEPIYIRVNQWRAIPRLLVALYGWVFYDVATWFMALPDPNSQQAAFVSTIAGVGAAFFGFYVNSGKND